MLVIGSLLPPDKQPLLLADKLGDGRDGEVFALKYLRAVVKFSVLFDLEFNGIDSLLARYGEIAEIYHHLDHHPQSHIVSLHGYECLHQGIRSTVNGNQFYLIYYTVMEYLNKLTEDEKKVFHTILSHEDANMKKLFGQERLQEVLTGLSAGLDFDRKKVESFYYAVISGSVYHNDIHPRNIMKDDGGNFKLVDLDHCTLKE